MQRDTWRKLDEVFHQALELDADQRSDFLKSHRKSDPELVAEVEAMLEVARPTGELEVERRLLRELDTLDHIEADGEVIPLAGSSTGRLATGTVIDDYRIVERIGEGGTATVYRAERSDEQYEQDVAIKVVHSDLRAARLSERLKLERQILARLNHPNIAKLLDGGVLDDGRPYLVMELVRGQPLLAYCDERNLSLPERLGLFLAVCRAVRFAHRRLIVHRDLKPSNILVGDEDGEVRLLDFGIAKLLDDEDTPGNAAQATRTQHRMLTPEYASPEQFLGEPITTGTDVYSLGLLLCELLSGWQPQRTALVKRGQLPTWVDDDSPPRPSTAASNAGGPGREEIESIAARRQSTPKRLRRDLTGDLDNIATRCLRRSPDQRYSSVDELAEDLRRHQLGLPVSATAGSVSYRASKFFKRHRLPVSLAAAALLALISFTSATVMQSRAVIRERDAAREERDRANEVSQLLVDLFDADPYAEQSRNRDSITIREFLQTSDLRLRERLADQPILRASLLSLLGRLEGNLGDLDRSLELSREALDTRMATHGESHPEIAESLNYVGTVLQNLGRFDEAEEVFRRALDMRIELYGREHLSVAESLNNLMVVLTASDGSIAERERLLLESLEIKRKLLGDDNLDVAQGLNNLGVLVWQRGEPGDLTLAEERISEALAIRQRLLGELHPHVANTKSNLANLLHDVGRLDEATALFESAIDIWSRTLGDDHTQVAIGLFGLSKVLADQGDLAGAEETLRRSMAIDQAQRSEDHPYVSNGHRTLGLLLLEAKRPHEAVDQLQRAAMLAANRNGDGDQRTVAIQVDLVRALRLAGEEEDAEQLEVVLRRVLASAAAAGDISASAREELVAALESAREETRLR